MSATLPNLDKLSLASANTIKLIEYRKKFIKPEKEFLTIKEAYEFINHKCSERTLQRMCKNNKLYHEIKRKEKRKFYLVERSSLERLRKKLKNKKK